MKAISQQLLTFLLNAGWQIALITLAAALCNWFLRGAAARFRAIDGRILGSRKENR